MKLALRAMIRTEFRQVLRDPRTLSILLLVPLMLLILFGYAVNMDVEMLSIAVIDGERSPESRRVAELFRVVDLFTPVELSDGADASDAEEALVDGRIDAAIIIPPGFGADLVSGKRPSIQVLIDGSNVTVATAAQSAIEGAFLDLSTRLPLEWRSVPSSMGLKGSAALDFRSRTWFNPELRSAVFLVPGLISFIMVITAVISTALSVVREKEKGTMEMLEASPLPPIALILGKTVPYMVVSLLETLVILAAGRLLFGVEIRGSFLLLMGVSSLFILSCLGIGLIISTIAETQQTAFLIATVATVLPSFILSGFVFPIRNMPIPVQAVTWLIPARHFLDAERAIIIRGAGLSSVWPQICILAFMSVFTLALSGARLGLSRRRR